MQRRPSQTLLNLDDNSSVPLQRHGSFGSSRSRTPIRTNTIGNAGNTGNTSTPTNGHVSNSNGNPPSHARFVKSKPRRTEDRKPPKTPRQAKGLRKIDVNVPPEAQHAQQLAARGKASNEIQSLFLHHQQLSQHYPSFQVGHAQLELPSQAQIFDDNQNGAPKRNRTDGDPSKKAKRKKQSEDDGLYEPSDEEICDDSNQLFLPATPQVPVTPHNQQAHKKSKSSSRTPGSKRKTRRPKQSDDELLVFTVPRVREPLDALVKCCEKPREKPHKSCQERRSKGLFQLMKEHAYPVYDAPAVATEDTPKRQRAQYMPHPSEDWSPFQRGDDIAESDEGLANLLHLHLYRAVMMGADADRPLLAPGARMVKTPIGRILRNSKLICGSFFHADGTFQKRQCILLVFPKNHRAEVRVQLKTSQSSSDIKAQFLSYIVWLYGLTDIQPSELGRWPEISGCCSFARECKAGFRNNDMYCINPFHFMPSLAESNKLEQRLLQELNTCLRSQPALPDEQSRRDGNSFCHCLTCQRNFMDEARIKAMNEDI
eukprot:m.111318 g.111318  ORF g.111318 m.111318 type:complete len:541 (-) comp22772_c0_seq3:283-1905(-)